VIVLYLCLGSAGRGRLGFEGVENGGWVFFQLIVHVGLCMCLVFIVYSSILGWLLGRISVAPEDNSCLGGL
jgi:hypothetical protein